jgi:hypothetical protein
MFRISRVLFGGRITHYLGSLVLSIAVLVLGGLVLWFLVSIAAGLLERLPV